MPHQPAEAPAAEKHFSTSILLWMRSDKPRQQGMDRWKGPHSGIIAATPGLLDYRQLHLAETNPGLWPAVAGVETAIDPARRVDGVAEVTQGSLLAPLRGREQTRLAFEDEVNIFQRTILYAGAPGASRWYDVAPAGAVTGARSLVYLRRRPGVKRGELKRFVQAELVGRLAGTGLLTELRTQVFLPWQEKMWDTPNVAHDNPKDQRFHASLILGTSTRAALSDLFASEAVAGLSGRLAELVSAVHAYDVEATLTYVQDGKVLS